MVVLDQRVDRVDVVLRFVFLEHDQHGFAKMVSACLILVLDCEIVAEIFEPSLNRVLDDLVNVIGHLVVDEVDDDKHAQEQ